MNAYLASGVIILDEGSKFQTTSNVSGSDGTVYSDKVGSIQLAKSTGTMTVYCPDGITSVDYYLARTGSFGGKVLGCDDGVNFTEITEYSGSKGIKELSVTLDTPYKYVQLTNTASGSLHVQGIIVMRVKGDDAIQTVRLDSSPAGVAYDLMGRKVRSEQRGVRVSGGRVVLVK